MEGLKNVLDISSNGSVLLGPKKRTERATRTELKPLSQREKATADREIFALACTFVLEFLLRGLDAVNVMHFSLTSWRSSKLLFAVQLGCFFLGMLATWYYCSKLYDLLQKLVDIIRKGIEIPVLDARLLHLERKHLEKVHATHRLSVIRQNYVPKRFGTIRGLNTVADIMSSSVFHRMILETRKDKAGIMKKLALIDGMALLFVLARCFFTNYIIPDNPSDIRTVLSGQYTVFSGEEGNALLRNLVQLILSIFFVVYKRSFSRNYRYLSTFLQREMKALAVSQRSSKTDLDFLKSDTVEHEEVFLATKIRSIVQDFIAFEDVIQFTDLRILGFLRKSNGDPMQALPLFREWCQKRVEGTRLDLRSKLMERESVLENLEAWKPFEGKVDFSPYPVIDKPKNTAVFYCAIPARTKVDEQGEEQGEKPLTSADIERAVQEFLEIVLIAVEYLTRKHKMVFTVTVLCDVSDCTVKKEYLPSIQRALKLLCRAPFTPLFLLWQPPEELKSILRHLDEQSSANLKTIDSVNQLYRYLSPPQIPEPLRERRITCIKEEAAEGQDEEDEVKEEEKDSELQQLQDQYKDQTSSETEIKVPIDQDKQPQSDNDQQTDCDPIEGSSRQAKADSCAKEMTPIVETLITQASASSLSKGTSIEDEKVWPVLRLQKNTSLLSLLGIEPLITMKFPDVNLREVAFSIRLQQTMEKTQQFCQSKLEEMDPEIYLNKLKLSLQDLTAKVGAVEMTNLTSNAGTGNIESKLSRLQFIERMAYHIIESKFAVEKLPRSLFGSVNLVRILRCVDHDKYVSGLFLLNLVNTRNKYKLNSLNRRITKEGLAFSDLRAFGVLESSFPMEPFVTADVQKGHILSFVHMPYLIRPGVLGLLSKTNQLKAALYQLCEYFSIVADSLSRTHKRVFRVVPMSFIEAFWSSSGPTSTFFTTWAEVVLLFPGLFHEDHLILCDFGLQRMALYKEWSESLRVRASFTPNQVYVSLQSAKGFRVMTKYVDPSRLPFFQQDTVQRMSRKSFLGQKKQHVSKQLRLVISDPTSQKSFSDMPLPDLLSCLTVPTQKKKAGEASSKNFRFRRSLLLSTAPGWGGGGGGRVHSRKVAPYTNKRSLPSDAMESNFPDII